MCIRVCVFMCLYVSLCIYVYMYICIYVYMYICTYVYMYICIYVYMYICIYVFMYMPQTMGYGMVYSRTILQETLVLPSKICKHVRGNKGLWGLNLIPCWLIFQWFSWICQLNLGTSPQPIQPWTPLPRAVEMVVEAREPREPTGVMYQASWAWE